MSEQAREGFYQALRDDDAVALYDQAPCGYLSTSPDGLIVKVNRTFLTLTGYRRDELVGVRTFAQLLTGGGRIYHETHYAPMLRMQGSAHEVALDLVRPDGGRLPVLVNSVLESDAQGDPKIIRIAVFDATSRREYERELLRARKVAEDAVDRARTLTRTLQQTLIPPALPTVPGLDIAAAYRPAGDGEEVGGDFYDVFQIAEDDWAVVLGDVRGKGVEAAIVTALARHTLRAAMVSVPTPAAALALLNEVLLRQETSRFLTAAVLRLRRAGLGWAVQFSTGGHPLPLRLTADGSIAAFGQIGPLVGIFDQPAFPQTHDVLNPGDSLVLFTDGVTEGRVAEGRVTEGRSVDAFYGQQRLEQTVIRCLGSAGSVADGLLDDVLAFQSGRPRDDIAIVAIRIPDPSGQSS